MTLKKVVIGHDHGDIDSYVTEGERKYYLISIGKGSYFTDLWLDAASVRSSILVGRYTSVGQRVVFEIGYNHDHHMVSTYPFRDFKIRDDDVNHFYENNHYQIIIGNDVWIGEGVKILGGVHIGNGAVIGMGAVVTKDVPPYSVVVGNPARVVKYRFDKDTIQKLESIKWWNWTDEAIEAAREDMTDPVRFVDKYYKEISIPENDFTQTMDEAKNAGSMTFYFALDNDSPRPLWDKVLAAFCEAFSSNNNMTLFLEVPDSLDSVLPEEDLNKLNAFLAKCPGIVAISGDSAASTAILCHVSTYIASSCVKAIYYVDMAELLGIEVRSACDWESGLFE